MSASRTLCITALAGLTAMGPNSGLPTPSYAGAASLEPTQQEERAQPPGDRSQVQRARPSGTSRQSGDIHALGHSRTEQPNDQGDAAVFPEEFRSIDGSGNNLGHPAWGAADHVFLRVLRADYGDGSETPAGAHRPSPRAISNDVVAQTGSLPNERKGSDFVWMWGQFLDHDLTETPVAEPAEPFDISVPQGDPWFDPYGTGQETIPLDRSAYDVVRGVRQQINLITSFIDASNVYGSEIDRALELRTLDGTGRLKTSAGNLLPYNENGFPNAPDNDPSYFLAGDVRANEQVALTAMHTLFVREHNHWALALGRAGSQLSGHTIYQLARAVVGAEMQAITYNEFLPALLGRHALRRYRGYRADVNPSISNLFAAAAYRFGHTMLSPELLRLQPDGSTHPAGHLPLSQAFFNPDELTSIGLEPYLFGLSRQQAQEIDPYLIDEVRNLLFGPPGAGGFDLASLNIQRGRDHGLPSYNAVRIGYGRSPARDFDDVTSDPEIRERLERAYERVEDIDAWVGLLSEDHARGAMVGRSLQAVLRDQFERLRAGDRFWYEAFMSREIVRFIERQTLATIIRRNTTIDRELSDNVFRVRR